MIYRAIGLMSGSSLDGLDIVYVLFDEQAAKWSFEIVAADCVPYDEDWAEKLKTANSLSAKEYHLLHTAYGRYLGNAVNGFIEKNGLQYKVSLLASHGHTVFHFPDLKTTVQLGDGASIAALTRLPVISDLRALDVALGGQGAPIVPIGEKLLWSGVEYFLNIGGIANISYHSPETCTAFDICAANRVLNILAARVGKSYDSEGALARSGTINYDLLTELNALEYYTKSAPKSLANEFGTETVMRIIEKHNLPVEALLSTYTEHIALQIKNAFSLFPNGQKAGKMVVTGGGAFNTYLIERISFYLSVLDVEVVIPDENTVKYKEALIMALIGVLRWREEVTTLATVTGAVKNSVGGAFWMGQE